MELVAVIPARMASSRFPGKPLVDLCGKPMIQRVYEAVLRAKLPSEVVIATPDQEIVDACLAFGARAVMTRGDHLTGTDRVAEAATQIAADAYINIQGDEPLVPPETIDACARPVVDGIAEMSSVYDVASPDEAANPNVVKVVTDVNGRALYFSRSPIPYCRGERDMPGKKHIGIYTYNAATLRAYSEWEPSPLEKSERLEQLRFLENGISIYMIRAVGSPIAVDLPSQAEEARRILSARGET